MGLKVDAVSDQVLLGLAKGFEHLRLKAIYTCLYAPFEITLGQESFILSVKKHPIAQAPNAIRRKGFAKMGRLS
ncbi:MAG: hypothetical protein R2865_11350 [Deinococcales bacterium]